MGSIVARVFLDGDPVAVGMWVRHLGDRVLAARPRIGKLAAVVFLLVVTGAVVSGTTRCSTTSAASSGRDHAQRDRASQSASPYQPRPPRRPASDRGRSRAGDHNALAIAFICAFATALTIPAAVYGSGDVRLAASSPA
jgi:hypothetical protein